MDLKKQTGVWICNLNLLKTTIALFNLRRSAVDLGPEFIWLNLKIYYYIRSDRKNFCCNDKLLYFKNGSKYEVCLGTMEYLLSEIDRLDSLFKIVCHMIVYSKSASREFGECNNEEIKLLSTNMLELYLSAQNFDMKLVFDDNIILAHRAILCSQNEYFSSQILEGAEDDDECTIINFTDMLDYKAMTKILAFLYTGDKRHVLEEPSFAIYYCAFFLGIKEILNYYKPDKLNLKSTIDLRQYTYSLYGYKFKNSRLSWSSDTEKSTKMYQLRFYPRIEHKSDYIPLFTETLEKDIKVSLKIDFIDKSDNFCNMTLFIVMDSFDELDNIIGGIVNKLISRQSVLEMVINLKLTRDIKASRTDEQRSVFVSCIQEDLYYKRLSERMKKLLLGGNFADFLINGFRVHKCILASRSRIFLDILTANEGGADVPDIEPHILFPLISYIYTGDFIGVIGEDDDVIDVYKAAVWSIQPQLKEMCSFWLKIFCQSDRNIRCRVVRLAEDYQDTSLMESVLNILIHRSSTHLTHNHLLSFPDAHICIYCR